MKIFFRSLVIVFLCLPAFAQTTWYVSPTGGTRFDANVPTGLCDGKSPAAPVGTTPNQHCAFGDAGYLAFDGFGSPAAGKWVIAGGDTVNIAAGQYRVGYRGPQPANHNGLAVAGNPFAPAFPPPPSGTAAHPTQFIGAGVTLTQIFGGYGAKAVFDLSGSSFITFSGIEFTRHSQCTKFGVPAVPASCNTGYPLDDYADAGFITSNTTHDIIFTNLYIHGFTSRGIIGPIGGTVTANNVDIAYNGGAGWDFDDGNATPSVNALLQSTGGLTIEWNGCNQAYPGPGAASCYGQNDGGYGDGLGTPAGTCISQNLNGAIFRYNTQDGDDSLHNDTGTCKMTMTNSLAYGNMGAQVKAGPANSPFVFTGNTVIGNCYRMLLPIAGNTTTGLLPADGCRAGDMMPIDFYNNGTYTLSNNTFVTYAPTTFDLSCVDPTSCANTTFTLSNNIILGYDDPNTYAVGGQAGGPGGFCLNGCNGSTLPLGSIVRKNNTWFGMRNFTPVATEIVANPLFVNQPAGTPFVESELDNFNIALTTASPAQGEGATASVVVGTPPVVVPPVVVPPIVVPPPVIATPTSCTWTVTVTAGGSVVVTGSPTCNK